MYFPLSEEQEAVRDTARRYARERLARIQEEDERAGIFRREVVAEMGELGFFGAIIPEAYGGTNLGFLAAVLIVEELAAVSASYASHFVSQTAGPGLCIIRHGSEEQKERYVPLLVRGNYLGSFAATEPDAGSDVASMQMTAIRGGRGYILNGTKTWITNATIADICLVFAYTDKGRRHHGISCFLVDMGEAKGIIKRPIEKLGLSCSVTGEMVFQDVEVPGEALLGAEGEGFSILMEMLSITRLFAAARALGVSRACLEGSINYARQRRQFGKSIAEFQMIQEQIAQMYVEHEAARLLVYQAAANRDRGRGDLKEVATAKYMACEAAARAADMALRIFGAYGYALEYPVQRWLRDSRAFPITEGTSNIQKIIIARELLGL